MTYVYRDDPLRGADFTDDPSTRFNGLPGHPEVWYEEGTGKVYMVYFPPGIEPPVPILYHVPNEDVLKAYFGDQPMGYDKRFTPEQLSRAGAVMMGETGAIAESTGDPWAGFIERVNRAAEVMPYLDDPEIFQVIAGAFLEGREVQDWEFEGTDWWQKHTAEERAWLQLNLSDPATAQQRIGDFDVAVRDLFRRYGVYDPDDAIVTYIRDQWVKGSWSQTFAETQVQATLGFDVDDPLDAGLSKVIGSVGGAPQATAYTDKVRDLYDEWLGPAFAPDAQTVQRWVNRINLEPMAGEDELIEHLRRQRLAVFPEYENPNATYRDIAAPWKSFVSTIWGTIPDDTDSEFQSMLRLNDAAKISREARRVGVDRDYDRVKEQMMGDLRRQMRRNIRGVV